MIEVEGAGLKTLVPEKEQWCQGSGGRAERVEHGDFEGREAVLFDAVMAGTRHAWLKTHRALQQSEPFVTTDLGGVAVCGFGSSGYKCSTPVSDGNKGGRRWRGWGRRWRGCGETVEEIGRAHV